MLNEYNKLKLSDFGLARKTTDYMNPSKETFAQGKSGSPFYMAPELF
jgi:serine/threonine protein kinase